MAGILYIVATPIGNLEDITLRALRVLKEAALIACEDTRHTGKLLDHFGIRKPTVSYHEHNEPARAAEIVRQLESGADVALVSDAGTPLISDPGYRLVAAAIAAGIAVVPIPGANAAVTALSASGLPTDNFRFCGFLPPKTTQRRKLLEALKQESGTLIFYEAPHRIAESLDDIAAIMGTREIVIARELTKLHEEFLRGKPADLRDKLSARGEITILIGKATEPGPSDTPIPDQVKELEQQGVARMDAIKQVAKSRGLSKREVYKLVSE
jgi:16S rRNA (cytidine1402-2'-O)-methyltransferase